VTRSSWIAGVFLLIPILGVAATIEDADLKSLPETIERAVRISRGFDV